MAVRGPPPWHWGGPSPLRHGLLFHGMGVKRPPPPQGTLLLTVCYTNQEYGCCAWWTGKCCDYNHGQLAVDEWKVVYQNWLGRFWLGQGHSPQCSEQPWEDAISRECNCNVSQLCVFVHTILYWVGMLWTCRCTSLIKCLVMKGSVWTRVSCALSLGESHDLKISLIY